MTFHKGVFIGHVVINAVWITLIALQIQTVDRLAATGHGLVLNGVAKPIAVIAVVALSTALVGFLYAERLIVATARGSIGHRGNP